MRIQEFDFEFDNDEMRGGVGLAYARPTPRSTHLPHVSNIIRDLENTITKPGQRRDDSDISGADRERLNRYREMGFMWELVVEETWKRRMQQRRAGDLISQEEIEYDGILMTPDGLYIPDWCNEEYKATWRSMKRAALDAIMAEFWAWFVQIKAYCLGQGTHTSRLFVFFVNGDYRPMVPRSKRYDIEFSDQDLDENWLMIKQHERHMRLQGRL